MQVHGIMQVHVRCNSAGPIDGKGCTLNRDPCAGGQFPAFASSQPADDSSLRLQYSMAVVRLVNGIADAAQKGRTAVSVAFLAAQAGRKNPSKIGAGLHKRCVDESGRLSEPGRLTIVQLHMMHAHDVSIGRIASPTLETHLTAADGAVEALHLYCCWCPCLAAAVRVCDTDQTNGPKSCS